MRGHAFSNASIAEKQIDGIIELREFDVSYPYSCINPRLTLSAFPPTLVLKISCCNLNDGYRIFIDKTTVDNKEYTALSELNVHLNPQHSTNSSPVEIMAIDTFVIKAMMTIMELNEYYEEKKS
ncbi:unnamed protein product [Rotaria sordida]|uniref:Uncharacterized protein n=1 Tax=Rotaria sordida TaxID=392033 RepID=A0A819R4Z9_9BILA|nr:unnamed protein product [Rotaria sordida]